MRYVAVFSLAAASLIGSASLPECADAQSNPYALDRLFLAQSQKQPLYEVLSFGDGTQVENYYGVGTEEARLATEFFDGCNSCGANMLFTRLPILSARAHLVGGNVSNLTLTQLQAINGTLSITSQGDLYSASINLSHVTSFKDAASVIQHALNRNLPVAAVTTGSSVEPRSVAFTGSVDGLLLTVSAAPSGGIKVGSMITGRGVPAGAQITSQVRGTPGGAGVYGLYVPEGHISTETLTASYGVLRVGSTSSGKVEIGQQVTGPGILSNTAIEAHLGGNTWLVNFAQTVASRKMTMTGAPLSVEYTSVTGKTEDRGFFSVQQNGDYLYNSSSLTYMAGTAANSLGLTQAFGAYLMSQGEIVPPTVASISAWMDNLVKHETDQFFSFQTTWDPADSIPPGEAAALEAWVKSTDGQFTYLKGYSANTPPIVGSPIVGSMTPNANQFSAAVGAAVPESSTWAMALLGFAGLGLIARYRPRGSTCASGREIDPMRRPAGGVPFSE
jgi:hypothetical protein